MNDNDLSELFARLDRIETALATLIANDAERMEEVKAAREQAETLLSGLGSGLGAMFGGGEEGPSMKAILDVAGKDQ